MTYQAISKRYELKYLLTQRQKEAVLRTMAPYMALDQYGRTTIRNLYFDTGTFRLIRRSIEKPAYKEKLRMRSYQRPGPEDPVFLELKKNTNPWCINEGLSYRTKRLWTAYAAEIRCLPALKLRMKSSISGNITGTCALSYFFPTNGRRTMPSTAVTSG